MLSPSPLNGRPGRKKVAIVGLDRLTRRAAPWNDPDWDVWGVNAAHHCDDIHRDADGRYREDRHWQIHSAETWSVDERDWFFHATGVLTMVREQEYGLLETQKPDDFRAGPFEPYPSEEIDRAFPMTPLVSSFCLMIAFALLRGYQEIGLFGVESRGIGRELLIERPALFYWMGVAAGNKVDIAIPKGSTLIPCPAKYGIEYWREASWVAVEAERLLPARWIRELRSGSNLDTVDQVTAAAEA